VDSTKLEPVKPEAPPAKVESVPELRSSTN
jgi:hypothetical protein